MSFDRSQQPPRGHKGLGLRHTVVHALRLIRTRLSAWRLPHRRRSLPNEVVIGTLRRPHLAITMRATIVRTETAPPPIAVFLERIVSHPISPYCPRCSLPLEPWQADHRADRTPLGYECRPGGTQIRWKPVDIRNQVPRQVRRHLIMRHG